MYRKVYSFIYKIFLCHIGRRSAKQSNFDQASQVAESAIQCLLMNADWVYNALFTNKQPCVLDPKTGKLEHYIPGNLSKNVHIQQYIYNILRAKTLKQNLFPDPSIDAQKILTEPLPTTSTHPDVTSKHETE